MSWDFDLCDPVTKKVLETEEKHEIKGGTYCVGGTMEIYDKEKEIGYAVHIAPIEYDENGNAINL